MGLVKERIFENRDRDIFSEYPNLAQKEYKNLRHDNVAKVIHWKLCEKWGFGKTEKWYTHHPERVLESEDCKILCSPEGE